METQQIDTLEGRFVSIRGEMRHLRGKLDTFLSEPHEQPVEGFAPKEEKDAKYMRQLLNTCIGYLDRYEDRKLYDMEFEASTIRLFELAERMGNEPAEKAHHGEVARPGASGA